MTQPLIQDELAALKARADLLNLSYHPSIGVEKLREKVNAALRSQKRPLMQSTATPAEPTATAEETPGQKRKRLKDAASRLVRIRLTCMNPMKKDWPGEIITVGNKGVGTFRKFIPFTGAEDGWHVPHFMYEVLRDRLCQVFVTVKTKNGISVRKGKLIKEFSIEVLPQLTRAELHDLAQRQAMAGNNE